MSGLFLEAFLASTMKISVVGEGQSSENERL